MACLSCDFGGSSVKYALVGRDAGLTEAGLVPAPLSGREAFVETVGGLYDRFRDRIEGIAISLPGMIDPESGTLIASGVYAPILAGQAIPSLLRDRCPTRITVENDGKCGALAESWDGTLKGVEVGAVLVVGTAIGGGVIVGGNVLHGYGFSSGEFSFAMTNGDAYTPLNAVWMNGSTLGLTYKVCKYKNLDLSVQDAAGALIKYDRLFRDAFPKPAGEPAPIRADGRAIFRWLDEGDPDAERAYREFLRSLVILIHNIQVTVAPETVVLGGGLSREKRLLPDLRGEQEAFWEACMVPPALRSRVVLSRYLRECNLIGAACHFYHP